MARITLNLPSVLSPEQQAGINRAWLAGGYDMTPQACEFRIENGRLVIIRANDESGTLFLPWPAAGGLRIVNTSTLRQRAEPYSLLRELIRGSINRIRNLVAALENAIVPIPAELRAELALTTRQFGRALCDPSSSDDKAQFELIDSVATLADKLAMLTSEFKLDSRKEANGGPLNVKLGCRLRKPLPPDEAAVYASTFNAVRIVPIWKQVEAFESNFQWSQLDPLLLWATTAGLDVTVGPLIDLSAGCLPDWLNSWENDLPSLTAFMSDYIGTIVGKYRQQVRTWQLFGGINNQPALGLSEDDRFRLAGRLLQSAREIDSSVKWSIGISQPYGDFLRMGHSRYSPLMFADTLLRSGFQVSAIDLDLTEGSNLGGNIPRDALDIMHILDLFETLGAPLTATLGGLNLHNQHLDGRLQAAASGFALQALYLEGWTADQGATLEPSQIVYSGSPDSAPLRDLRRLRTHWFK